jgi:hypothetical protein
MLIPADFLSGALMPWVLAAPALPLAFILFKKPVFNTLNIALLLICVVSMLTNILFNTLIQQPSDIEGNAYLLGILVDFGFSMFLLWNCTRHKLIRGMILAVCVMFCGAVSSLMIVNVGMADITSILGIGYLLIFALALSVIVVNAVDRSDYITDSPEFWMSAGLMFQFGIMALLLLMQSGKDASIWLKDQELGLMYTIVTCLRFILFSVGLLVGNKTDLAGESRLTA